MAGPAGRGVPDKPAFEQFFAMVGGEHDNCALPQAACFHEAPEIAEPAIEDAELIVIEWFQPALVARLEAHKITRNDRLEDQCSD